jgi:hypothetical protein
MGDYGEGRDTPKGHKGLHVNHLAVYRINPFLWRLDTHARPQAVIVAVIVLSLSAQFTFMLPLQSRNRSDTASDAMRRSGILCSSQYCLD